MTERWSPCSASRSKGAPFISSFNRGQAKKDAARLQPGATHLDTALAQLVAVREGVNAVVSGSIAKDGSGYKVSVTTVDPATGKTILTEEKDASSKQDVLAAGRKTGGKHPQRAWGTRRLSRRNRPPRRRLVRGLLRLRMRMPWARIFNSQQNGTTP